MRGVICPDRRVPVQSPMVERLDGGMGFVRVFFLAMFIAAMPLVAHGESGLVRIGEEIVVRFPPRSSSRLANAAAISPGTLGPLAVLTIDSSLAGAALSSPAFHPIPRGALTPATPAITARCREIQAQEPLAVCEPNWVYFATVIPKDPRIRHQYSISSLGLPNAWNLTTGSANVKVAVIDTGIDYSHPDLIENISRNTADLPANGIDDDTNGYVDDYLGFNFVERNGDPFDFNEHGTHVAGTIGAVGDNGIGIVGVNWRVGLVPVRVLDESGAGTLAEIVAGIEYAIARRVQIINLSLGGAEYSTIFEQAIDAAKDNGILAVVASGNESSINDLFETFPANFKGSNIISVAAVDSADALAFFSNIGPKTVDLAAPGIGVLSTIPGGRYARFDGTSMAAPHVAGVAALLLALNPQFSYLDLRALLLDTVTRTAELSGLIQTGGILNASKAVEAAVRRIPTCLSLGLRLRLARRGAMLVVAVYDRDGGRAGVRITTRCGTGRRVIVTTKRSGKATVKLSKLTSRRSTVCRATTSNLSGGTKSDTITIRGR